MTWIIMIIIRQLRNMREQKRNLEREVREVVLPDMIGQDISRMEEAIIYLEEIGVQEEQPI